MASSGSVTTRRDSNITTPTVSPNDGKQDKSKKPEVAALRNSTVTQQTKSTSPEKNRTMLP